ncbi:MAG: histidinol-phosphate transaminase [Chloroflexota bacterium]|nr:histidinol-phosphate aminotransferase family protein [Dehalococcoidia bacterium]MDW8255033.1 histidinol-phosphate transaminase [Chloroflexota bacterium]
MTVLRPELLTLAEVPHGSLAASEAHGRADVLDLSANLSPLGPPPAVIMAVRAARLDAYPEPDARTFRAAVADRVGVTPEQVAAGNGASELIWLAALAAVRPGARVPILGPTFGEYARAVRVAGGEPVLVHAQPPDFLPPVEAFVDALERLAPPIAFLCNPNNPTGALLPRSAIERLLRAAPATLLVIDEAYLPFSGAPDLVPLLEWGNVLLIRSLTKVYAIPGVRLGYALASPAVATTLRRIAPPWSVSAPAIAAGLAALRDPAWEQRAAATARLERERLAAGLRARGLRPLPSAANFLLVAVPNAPAVRRTLLERGVLVRDCASFGLPDYLRIAAGPPNAIDRLLAVWPAREDER